MARILVAVREVGMKRKRNKRKRNKRTLLTLRPCPEADGLLGPQPVEVPCPQRIVVHDEVFDQIVDVSVTGCEEIGAVRDAAPPGVLPVFWFA